MPASVYLIGMLLGIESWHLGTAANMAVVIAGVAVANYGEVHDCSARMPANVAATLLRSSISVAARVLAARLMTPTQQATAPLLAAC